MIACSTIRTVDMAAEPAAPKQSLIHVKDKVTITTRSGTTQALVVTDVASEYIEGIEQDSGKVAHIELKEISKIQFEEIDGVKTAVLVLAIVGGIFVVTRWLGRKVGTEIADSITKK
jgi:hypothetical protein